MRIKLDLIWREGSWETACVLQEKKKRNLIESYNERDDYFAGGEGKIDRIFIAPSHKFIEWQYVFHREMSYNSARGPAKKKAVYVYLCSCVTERFSPPDYDKNAGRGWDAIHLHTPSRKGEKKEETD